MLACAVRNMTRRDQAECAMATDSDAAAAARHFAAGESDRVAGLIPRALAHYQQAVLSQPDHGEAHDRLGVVLWKLGRWSESLAAFERAAGLRPSDAEIATHLAEAHRELGQPDRAAHYYREALSINRAQPGAAKGLGFALIQVGILEEGIAHLRDSLNQQPNQPQIYHTLSQLAAEGWCELRADELEGMQTIACNANYPPFERSQCAFGLGLILHERGAYDEAMGYYRLANNLKKSVLREQGIQFDRARHEAMVDCIIALFDRAFIERARGWGIDTELPIFIVGMPRSGSTLVEQILASHRQVFGAGECGDFQQFTMRLHAGAPADPYSIPIVHSCEETHRLGTEYLRFLREIHATAARIINKTLHNFLHLGLIATMFPRARIIHCRREPLDACLSCYLTNFKIVDFAWSLEEIGAYYCAYEKLMAHWARVLPATIKVVRYEDLIEGSQPVTRDLIDFCGLDWDDRCLEFHKTSRVVKTASAIQVRKPIHKRALGRWRHYRAHLGPLFAALGMPAAGPHDPGADFL